ncbi:MAG: hypothetical protein ACI86M_002759 [Saprospiraceae bacterium]
MITISNNIRIPYGSKLRIEVFDKDAAFGDDSMLDEDWEADFPISDTSISLNGSGSTIIIDNYELVY